MSEEVWRPLGVDSEHDVAEYDALHDGIPPWMKTSFWAWVREALTVYRSYADHRARAAMLDTDMAERMCQALRITFPNLRSIYVNDATGKNQFESAMPVLRAHGAPLQIADYLLAHDSHAQPDVLGGVLEHSKSAHKIGVRAGRPGLVRRVPIGVQVAADSVMARSGRAGIRLAKAWEELYGLVPNASEGYRLAILAVEDAAVPVVSPNNQKATLGTIIRQLEDQPDWRLPMDREHERSPSREVLVGMLRMLWHGQHDRHGGQPSAPGNVSIDEAQVAVSLAVVLVQWFDAELVQPRPSTP